MKNKFLILLIIINSILLINFPSFSDDYIDKLKIKVGLNLYIYKDNQKFYLYIPKDIFENKETGKLLVIIHGYSGRKLSSDGLSSVQKSIIAWVETANYYNFVLLAPQFDEVKFNNDYQRLNFNKLRADLRLNELIEIIKIKFNNVYTDKIKIFGFSGGGQFVHRYCAFHPEKIEKAVAGSSGWYMWLDENLQYPIGIKLQNNEKKISIEKYLLTNLLIIVGSEDMKQGDFRETYEGFDISSLEGNSRYERAINWYNLVKKYSEDYKIKYNIEFNLIEDTKHQISDKLFNASRTYLLK